eukprot:scaffold3087_cov130-Alexandrium_tamarense.AAC.17
MKRRPQQHTQEEHLAGVERIINSASVLEDSEEVKEKHLRHEEIRKQTVELRYQSKLILASVGLENENALEYTTYISLSLQFDFAHVTSVALLDNHQ